MANNDNWDEFETNTDGFTDAWDDAASDGFEDIEIDIPEPVSAADSFNAAPQQEETEEGPEIPAFSFERPVRKIDPRKHEESDEEIDLDNDDSEEETEDKKGKGVTALIIVISLLVIAALIFLAIKLVGGGEQTPVVEETTSGVETEAEPTTAAWELNGNPEVVSLINSYYAARTLVDTYTLTQLVDSSVTIDADAVANEAEVVEGYQDITCYIAEGQVDGEWVAYVSYAIKFKNINTPAPGLVAVYVKTDESGALKLIPWEAVQKDETIYSYIAEISECDTITALAADVDSRYKAAIESDEDLKAYIVGLTGTEEATSEEPSEATTEATTTAQSADEETDFVACDDMQYITKDGVNVRSKGTTDSDVIKSLNTGDYVEIIGKGTEWYKVRVYVTVDGEKQAKIGYVKKDFFSPNEP